MTKHLYRFSGFSLALLFLFSLVLVQPVTVSAAAETISCNAGGSRTLTAGTYTNSDGTQFTAGADLTLNAGSGTTCTFTFSGTMTVNSLTIATGITLTHGANTTAQTNILTINATTVDIQSGGIINLDGKGYSPGAAGGGTGNGPGGGQGISSSSAGGAGGAHAGNGGNGNFSATGGTPYCTLSDVATMGSGGGGVSGAGTGYGGGLVIINASGTVTVNGTITADGIAGNTSGNRSGGGGGGGVKIVADTVTGTPTSFTVTGGAATTNAGGGGGGCAQIVYTTANSIGIGNVSVEGGLGSNQRGGAGQLFIQQVGTDGDLYVKNGGTGPTTTQTLASLTLDSLNIYGAVTYSVPTGKTITPASFGGDSAGTLSVTGVLGGELSTISDVKVTINSGGTATLASTFTLPSDMTLTLSSGSILTQVVTNLNTAGNLTLGANSTFTITNLNITGGTTTLSNYTTAVPLELASLTMSAGTLTHTANTTAQTHVLNLVVSGNLDIQAGAAINVDGKGYSAGAAGGGLGNGPGGGGGIASATSGAAGGAHGGNGGNGTGGTGGTAYCSIADVATIGSGGGGTSSAGLGHGGGLIMLDVAGTLTVNGTLTADGSAGNGSSLRGGGGGGGGMKIITDVLTGTLQSFTATGGVAGTNAGGGGGGCIQIEYGTLSMVGDISVSGGSGSNASGQAGLLDAVQVNTNSAPTISFVGTPSQTTTTKVSASVTVGDMDLNETAIAVEYSLDNSVFSPATISEVSSISEGAALILGETIYEIDTDLDGTVVLTFLWDIGTDLPNTEDTTVYLRVTPDDGTIEGTAATSSAFAVDTIEPTAPGTLSTTDVTATSFKFVYGAPTVDTNFTEYKIYYSDASPVTTADTALTDVFDVNLGSIDFGSATETVDLTGLTPNTEYFFAIYAYDSFGNVSNSAESSTTTLLAVPTTLTVGDVTTSSIDLSWNANGNPGTVTYEIYNVTTSTLVSTVADTTYTVTGLSSDTGYQFKVRAKNLASEYSSYTDNTALTYTLANQVSGLTVTNTTDIATLELELSWTEANQDGIKIEIDTDCNGSFETVLEDSVAVNIANPLTIDSGIVANTCYEFRAMSYNQNGDLNELSIPESNQITTPPGQVFNLTTDNIEENEITWTWSAVTGATTYEIYNADTDVLLSSVSAPSQYYTKTGLSLNTSHSIYARAKNANGEGIASSTSTATTDTSAPTGLTATNVTSSSIRFNWENSGQTAFYARDKFATANNSGWVDPNVALYWDYSSLTTNTAYTIQVKARNSSLVDTAYTEITAYTAQNVPTAIDFLDVTATTITLNSSTSGVGGFVNNGVGSAVVEFTNTDTSDTSSVSAGAIEWTNSGLSPNVEYTYEVIAYNSAGLATGGYSESTYTLAEVPGIPVVSLGDVDTTLNIDFAADANSSATTYSIYNSITETYLAADGSDNGATPVYLTKAAWGDVVATGLEANTDYRFSVVAKNSNDILTDASGLSASIYTLATPPEIITAEVETATTARLIWSDTAPEYRVVNSTLNTEVTQADTELLAIDLTCGTTYNFVIYPINVDGNENGNGTSVAVATEDCPQADSGTTTGSYAAVRVSVGDGGGGGGGGDSVYEAEIKAVLEAEIITEEPTNEMNKCEALTVMSRVFEWETEVSAESHFMDVPDWCKSVANFAYENEIVFGRFNRILGLDTAMTRYEVAVMLHRELLRQEYDFKTNVYTAFSDPLVDWALESVMTLAKSGIIKGYADGTFGGENHILKQDFAIMVYRTQ